MMNHLMIASVEAPVSKSTNRSADLAVPPVGSRQLAHHPLSVVAIRELHAQASERSAVPMSEARVPREDRLAPQPRPSFQRPLSTSVLHPLSRTRPPAGLGREERIKAQRYDHTMNRFHLRRVPNETTSCANTAPRTNPLAAPDSSPPYDRRLSTQLSRASRASIVSLISIPVPASTSISELSSQPFAPTSLLTCIRLVILSVVFAVHLVYIPYAVVYLPPHYTLTIALDTLVDLIFLLNMLATWNTEIVTLHGQLLATRSAIWRYYSKDGFVLDVFATLPFELTLVPAPRHSWPRLVVCSAQISVRLVCVRRHINRFQAVWIKDVIGADKSVIAWLFYSRYSHLVRILAIILLITLMAHYLACLWSWLLVDGDEDLLDSIDPATLHLRSIYQAVQLLQGQGVTTSTPAQDVFGLIAVLLGSIALAVVFGHVAILVAHFSANDTSYQRKMESVFAVMTKLQLPHPIRERVHQYYEYLYAEYESLDGEVVKFAKDLSHTLELEVVLFKYMDVVMHVPHWHECSPDFQKQLVLHLSVRVYLPDDFIMRRGEVGTECYIINRGTCMLCEYPTGNYEHPTIPMPGETEGTQNHSRSRRRSSTSTASFYGRRSSAATSATTATPQRKSRFSVCEVPTSEFDLLNGPYSRVTVLRRGQAIGDMALLANYERSSDLRAVTYVEMCVLERDVFQKILTRYPRDRELVLASIVHHTMIHLEVEQVPCMFMRMVHDVAPRASVVDGIDMVVRAMNPTENDPSIVFGVTEQMSGRLQSIAGEYHHSEEPNATEREHHRDPEVTTPSHSDTGRSEATDARTEAIMAFMREVRERSDRIEARQVLHKTSQCPTCSSVLPAATRPVVLRPPRDPRVDRLIDLPSSRSQQGSHRLVSRSSRTETVDEGAETDPSTSSPSTARRRRVAQQTPRQTERSSPTPCADQLYGTVHIGCGEARTQRRSSLRRTMST